MSYGRASESVSFILRVKLGRDKMQRKRKRKERELRTKTKKKRKRGRAWKQQTCCITWSYTTNEVSGSLSGECGGCASRSRKQRDISTQQRELKGEVFFFNTGQCCCWGSAARVFRSGTPVTKVLVCARVCVCPSSSISSRHGEEGHEEEEEHENGRAPKMNRVPLMRNGTGRSGAAGQRQQQPIKCLGTSRSCHADLSLTHTHTHRRNTFRAFWPHPPPCAQGPSSGPARFPAPFIIGRGAKSSGAEIQTRRFVFRA